MKVFITKYVLTTGIQKREAIISNVSQDMIVVKTGMETSYYHKGEWFKSMEEALINAEERRVKKIASLEKSIAKLKKLDFRLTGE